MLFQKLLAAVDRRAEFLALVLVVVSVFWGIDRPFYTRGEAREALAAQAMVGGESWILPRVYDDRVPSKPPFTHWMMASSALALGGGMSESAARLPSAIAAILFGVFFYRWTKRRLGESALLCTLLLFTSIEWARAAVTSRVDMVFAAAIATAAMAVTDLAAGMGTRTTRFIIFLALSVGFLTKGPAAWVLVGAFAVMLAIYTRNMRVIVQSIVPAIGSVIVPGIWYFLAYQTGGDDFVAKVVSENFKRFSGTMDDQPHVHSALYLVGALFAGFMPWTLACFRSDWLGRGKEARAKFFICAALIFAGLILVFFSIPSSKRSVYLLPMYPSLAFVLGELLTRGYSKWTARLFQGFGLLLGVLLAGMILYSAVGSLVTFNFKNSELAKAALDFSVFEVFLGASIALGFIAWCLYDGKKLQSFALLVLAMIVFANGAVVPRVAEALTPRDFSRQIVSAGIPEGGLQSYQRDAYGVAYYSEHAVVDFKSCSTSVGYIVPISEFEKFSKSCGSFTEIFRSSRGIIKPHDIWAYLRIVDQR